MSSTTPSPRRSASQAYSTSVAGASSAARSTGRRSAAAPSSRASSAAARRSGQRSAASNSRTGDQETTSTTAHSSIREQLQQQEHQEQQQEDPLQKQQSFPDQLTNMALQGSIEILKLAGGISNKVVAPPLMVLLPNLWNALKDYIAQQTPRRGKDWFSILSTSVSQLIAILSTTTNGRAWLDTFGSFWRTLVATISSRSSRQVIIDTTAWYIKFYRLLATDECQACVNQGVVVGCRMIDSLYSHKQFWHDGAALFQSTITIMNDPQTTAALAEVTARLCLALEMEQAAMRVAPQAQESQRRRRNQQQAATYQDPILLAQPEATVEDVILSSLGCSPDDEQDENSLVDDDDDDDLSLSSSTTTSPLPSSSQQQQSGTDGDNENNNDDSKDAAPVVDIYAKPVNVEYLRQNIIPTQQPSSGEQEQSCVNAVGITIETTATGTGTSAPTTNINKMTATSSSSRIIEKSEDMEDLIIGETVPDEQQQQQQKPKRNRVAVQSGSANGNEYDDDDDDADGALNQSPPTTTTPSHPPQLDGESSLNYFYRVLDQVIQDGRQNGVDYWGSSTMSKTTTTASRAVAETKANAPRGRVCRPSSKVAASVGNAEDTTMTATMSSVWEQVQQAMSEAQSDNVDKQQRQAAKTTTGTSSFSLSRRIKILIFILVSLSAFFATTFAAFGCYGIYVFFWQPQSMTASRHRAAQEEEIVIRVIRQVVHVDASTGRVLDDDETCSSSSSSNSNSGWFSKVRGNGGQEQPQGVADKITECVANAVE